MAGKNGPFKIQTILSRFQMVGLPDFRFHSKSRPFATQPLLDIQNTGQVGFQIPTVISFLPFLIYKFANFCSFFSAGKASPEKCSSTSSDGSLAGENGQGSLAGEAMSSIRLSSSDSSNVVKEDDESADEFQDEIHFDPTISSGHLGFRDVSFENSRLK